MDNNTINLILKKLDNIEKRLSYLESPNENQIEKKDRDPLFSKALEVIDRYDEISAQQLAKELKVDIKRAEKIMDDLENAGIGICYIKDV